MLKRPVEERVLASVTAEARRSAFPEVGGDAFEARLLGRAAEPAEPPAPPARPRSERRSSAWALALLPAAALGLAALSLVTNTPPAPPSEPAASVAPANVDGDALAPERVIGASEHPLTVVHAGRAEWQLDPGSSAVLVDQADGIHVRLTRGSLRAHVVPGSRPDRFVVEVGETRVAVRGTVFRVELLGDQSRVEVEEGVVAVGPRSRPHAPARLLHAPAEGVFRLDGEPVEPASVRAAPRRPPAAAPAPRSVHLAPPPSASAAPAADAGESVAKELTIGAVEAGISAVVKTLGDCFAASTSGAGDVRISARTTLTLDVSPDGGVSQALFVPPLAPAVQACSERSLREVRFAPSEAGARVTRVLEFVR